MAENLLEVKGLNVVYSSGKRVNHALNGINFSVTRGEALGIVGETGAGKTTTALSIMGLLPERNSKIMSGEILFDSIPLLKQSESEMQALRGERMSMIFQDAMTSLNPVIPVGKQVEEALKLHRGKEVGKTELKGQVDMMFQMVGISPDRKHQYPHQFSGGMKQRIMIAIALACSPELLIADEPTTALDVTIQAQVLDMIVELQKKLDMSLVMITHDLGIIAKICDKVAVMYCGEVVEYGTFEDFFIGTKHHPYTEGLFGSIPDIYSDKPRLTPILGEQPDPACLPKGCKFHPRCTMATDLCRSCIPTVYVNGTHCVQCHQFGREDGYDARDPD